MPTTKNYTARSDISQIELCRYCHSPIASQRVSGGSPGCGESDLYGPDGLTWCPDAGELTTIEEWRSQKFPTLRNPNPDFKGYQYHEVVTHRLAA